MSTRLAKAVIADMDRSVIMMTIRRHLPVENRTIASVRIALCLSIRDVVFLSEQNTLFTAVFLCVFLSLNTSRLTPFIRNRSRVPVGNDMAETLQNVLYAKRKANGKRLMAVVSKNKIYRNTKKTYCESWVLPVDVRGARTKLSWSLKKFTRKPRRETLYKTVSAGFENHRRSGPDVLIYICINLYNIAR